jgi:hypothetical protein
MGVLRAPDERFEGLPGYAVLGSQRFSQAVLECDVAAIVTRGCVTDLAPDGRGASAPFPDERYNAGAGGQSHTTIAAAGHFLQDARGPELAPVVVDCIRRTGQ